MESNTTSVSGLLPPKDWFKVQDTSVLDDIKSMKWPWSNMTYDQWWTLYNSVAAYGPALQVPKLIITQLFVILGLIGNLCTLTTVHFSWRSESTISIFESTIAVSAVCDFAYSLFTITRQLIAKAHLPGYVLYYCIACGIANFGSIMSDMLTVCLTVDRYAALTFPVRYRMEEKTARHWGWIAMLAVSIVLSMTRLHFAFHNYYYTDFVLTAATWFIGLCFFSDMLLPFIMSFLLLPLALATCVSMVRRHKERVAAILTADSAGQELVKKVMKNISLLLVLVVMFFFNQIAYIIFAVSVYEDSSIDLTYESPLSDIESYARVQKFFHLAVFVCDIFEPFSRAMVFYAYILFNRNFRQLFLKALRRLLCLHRCSCGTVIEPVQEIPVATSSTAVKATR